MKEGQSSQKGVYRETMANIRSIEQLFIQLLLLCEQQPSKINQRVIYRHNIRADGVHSTIASFAWLHVLILLPSTRPHTREQMVTAIRYTWRSFALVSEGNLSAAQYRPPGAHNFSFRSVFSTFDCWLGIAEPAFMAGCRWPSMPFPP